MLSRREMCKTVAGTAMAQMIMPKAFGECLFDRTETPGYLTEQILTYLGNKRSLLRFIGDGILAVKKDVKKNKLSFFDVFSGCGIVSRFMKQHASYIVANDLERYSEVVNNCYLTNRAEVNEEEFNAVYHDWVKFTLSHLNPGTTAKFYAPEDDQNIKRRERVFYTRENAILIDSARYALDKVVPQKYFDLLLAPLLAEASIHPNTSGVFKGFYKARNGIGAFGGEGRNALTRICGKIELQKPILSRFSCPHRVLRKDALEAAHSIDQIDLAYFDPPYNQHPYGSNYFMLNIIADNVVPNEVSKVSGIPTNWNHSRYNKKALAEDTFFTLLKETPAKYLLISYNSEGFIKYDSFMTFLKGLGTVKPVEIEYNTFRGSRNLRNRSLKVTEYLFLVKRSGII